MLSPGWTRVCPAEIGGRLPTLWTRTRDNPWTSSSRLRRNFYLNIAATSGGRSEAATSRPAGDFASLSTLKLQLDSQAQARSGSGGFPGLSEMKEQTMFETRATSAQLSLERKKAANDRSFQQKGRASVCLMVSNLPMELTRAEYEVFMQKIPEISSCTYLTHKDGRCRGYGFCEIRAGADAAAVLEIISSQTLGGRALKASVATPKKDSDKDGEQQEEGRAKSVKEKSKGGGASLQEKARPASSSGDSKRKPAVKNVKATFKQQPQPSNFTRSDGDGSVKSSRESSEQRSEGGLETPEIDQNSAIATTSSNRYGRVSGQSVLAALERFASVGRAKQQKKESKGTRAGSTSSEPEDDALNSDEPQLIEFKLDWAERIQSLEASIQQLKRS